MPHRPIFRFLMLVLVLMLLVACTGGLSEDEAEETLKSVFQQGAAPDSDAFCPDYEPGGGELPDATSLSEVDCDHMSGDRMQCEMVFEHETEDDQTLTVIFTIQDNRLCGSTVE